MPPISYTHVVSIRNKIINPKIQMKELILVYTSTTIITRKHVNDKEGKRSSYSLKVCSNLCQDISIISSSDICSSTDCREEAPPATAMFFNNSMEVRTTCVEKRTYFNLAEGVMQTELEWEDVFLKY